MNFKDLLNSKLFFILIIVFSLFVSSCKKDNDNACQKTIDSLNAEIDFLIVDADQKSELIVNFNEKLDEFGNIYDSIQAREDEIASLQILISNKGYATANQSMRLNELFVQMDSLLLQNKDLARQFDSIDYKNASQQQIVELLFENIDDKQKQIDNLKQSVANLQTQVRGLKIDNKNLQRQTDSLITETENIINQANVVTLYDLNVNLPINNITKKVKKAKKVDEINICFTLNKNQFVPAGQKTVYIRILKPDGYLLDPSSSTFLYQGQQINYTLQTTIDYDPNGNNFMCKKWTKTTSDLVEGQYLVFIYVDGYELGNEQFTLR